MPGNEVADKLHNFFEQENSSQNHQSHTGDGLWPILNNDPWVGTLRQNGMPRSSNSNNSSIHSLDTGREKAGQSSQSNVNQFALNAGFEKSHQRNQQLGSNAFEHGLEGLQTRYKQGNARQHGFEPISNSERAEVAGAPVNVDFLGNQGQFMRNQNMHMSPLVRQHPGFNDMQSWQQHLLYKQKEELQRQQQHLQLDQGQAMQSVIHGYSNDLMFLNDQGQPMQSMDFSPQQLDSSLHGMPVSRAISSSIQYPHLQGRSRDCTNAMINAGGVQVYHASVQNQNNSLMPGNFQQVNHLQENVWPHGFQGRQEQSEWSRNLEEKAVVQVGPSCGAASLDPTEEKLLFGTGDDGNWDASFGSWSALVQDAVLGSCDDKGPGHNDRELTDASHESFQQSFREVKARQFDMSQKQKQFAEGGLQSQILSNGAANDFLARNAYNDPNILHSSDMEFNSQNKQQVWSQQQNVPLSDVSSQRVKPNGWNVNEPVALVGENTLKFQHNNNTKLYAQRNEAKRTMHVESTCDGSIWNVGGDHMKLSGLGQESDQGSQRMQMGGTNVGNFAAVTNSNTSKLGKEVHQKVLNRYQSNKGAQPCDSSLNSTGNGSRVTSDNNQGHPRAISNENFKSNHTNLGQPTDNGVVERENPLLTGIESHPSISLDEKTLSQAGRQAVAPRKFQYHPMGNLGMNVEPADSPRHPSYSQGLPRSVNGGFHNQEQGHTGVAQFADCVVSNNVVGMGKGQYTNMQRNIEEAKEEQSRSSIPNYTSTASASFGGTTVQFPQSKKIVQTSQNMLELLHKVEQSRESNNISQFRFSSHNMESKIPETAASDGSASHSQHNPSSILQGVGLRLAPPSQQQLILNHVLPSQASMNDFHTKEGVTEVGDKDQTRSTSTLSAHSLPAAHETSQRESSDNKSSGQTCNDTSYSSAQASSIQQQHEVMNQPVNLPSVSQVEVNAHAKHASLLGQSHDNYGQSGVSGRTPSLCLPSSADIVPALQLCHSQATNTGFYPLRKSAQQLSAGEKRPVSQSSATSGMSRQSGFSTMIHHVSAQQRSSGVQPHKLSPNMLQSILMSASSKDTSSWALQKADDRTTRGASAASELGACSSPQRRTDEEEYPVNDNSSQQTLYERATSTPKKGDTPQGQATTSKHLTDGNSSVSIPSLVHLPQQGSKGKGGQDPFPNSQAEYVPLPNAVSSSRIASYGHTSESSDTSRQNYSLMQQMQAMKGSGSDSDGVGKRLKRADFGSDPSGSACKAGQKFIYGQDTVFRIPKDGEHAATAHSSFPPDVKMLSFTSRENTETSASISSQLVHKEACSQDIYTSSQDHIQNYTHSLTISPKSKFMGGTQYPMIGPQMAPSCIEQFGSHKKGQILDTFDGQSSVKAAAQQFSPPNLSESIDNDTSVDQRADTSQTGSIGWITPFTTIAGDQSTSTYLLSDTTDQHIIPKKRKNATPELPWHKKVTQGSERLQRIRKADQVWAQVTNRLIEKDEAEMIDNCLSMHQSRKRLILTTQLMQQLLPSVPSAVLAAEASLAYESVAYFVAKEALGDACSLINSRFCIDNGNALSENLKTSEKVGNHIQLKIPDDLMGRLRKLEIDFSTCGNNQLKKRASLLDLRMECEELERFSITNRLAKFHGRSQTDGVKSPSMSLRTFPQRYVTALLMPENIPEGVPCLSL